MTQLGSEEVSQWGSQEVGNNCVDYITLLIIQLIIHNCCQLINNLQFFQEHQLVVQAGNQLVVQVGNQSVQVGNNCVHYIT